MSYITEHNLQKMHASAFFMSATMPIGSAILISNINITNVLEVSDHCHMAAVEAVV